MTTRQSEIAFSVLIDNDADPAVIHVAGELDSFTACELRAGIGEVLGRPGTILDIREVPFVDSAGLGAIVGGIRRLREAGASVALCLTRSSVIRLLGTTGLDRSADRRLTGGGTTDHRRCTGRPGTPRRVIG